MGSYAELRIGDIDVLSSKSAPEFPPKWSEEVGSRVGRRRGRADQRSRTWVVSADFLPTSSRSLSSRNSDHFASRSENSGAPPSFAMTLFRSGDRSVRHDEDGLALCAYRVSGALAKERLHVMGFTFDRKRCIAPTLNAADATRNMPLCRSLRAGRRGPGRLRPPASPARARRRPATPSRRARRPRQVAAAPRRRRSARRARRV